MRERILGEMFVISVGNSYDGITLYGPFDHDSAFEFVELNGLDEWHCVLIESPESI